MVEDSEEEALLPTAGATADSDTVSLGGPPAVKGAEELLRGASVGRYLILSVLGRGGMGQVYEAYDPKLGRKVAVKLLRTSVAGERNLRLMREAQAMAKLAHPNVVAVYDVGTHEGQVFLTMELVEGKTLRNWLAADGGKRAVREVLGVFLAAGRGLAAAHEAGLVHRDFKPENVLVGRDGQVKVTDFGLVRAASPEPDSESSAASIPPPPSGEAKLPAPPLTSASVLLGTPGYLSPEQYRRAPTDARSDQFSFCITLYEALYGERPFAGSSMAELAAATERGHVAPEPKDARVPASLRRALLRGLEVKPEDRFPSMDALLAALGPDPRRARRWALGLGVATLACLTAAGVWLRGQQQRLLCTGAERHLAGVWDATLKRDGERAFQAAGLPYAASTWTLVRDRLDAFAARWVAMRTEACEATRLRHEQPEEVLALRMSCLDGRLRQLSALTHLLATADAEVIAKATDAAGKLGGVELCGDLAALRRPVPPPPNEAVAAKVDALRKTFAEALVRLDAGKAAAGLQLMEPAVAEAASLEYLPVHAEALVLFGRLAIEAGRYPEAEQALEKAFFLAHEGKDDAAAAQATVHLTGLLGFRLHRPEKAHEWERIAEAAVRRLGGDAELEIKLHARIGMTYYSEQRYPEAIEHARRALELCQRTLGADHSECGDILNNLGVALRVHGERDEAKEMYLRALAIREKATGPDHPLVANIYNNLGNLMVEQGRIGDGLVYLEKARAIWERGLGADHPNLAMVLTNMAGPLLDLKRPKEALECAQRALAINERRLPPDHPNLVLLLATLGEAQLQLGKPAEAITPLERALSILKPEQVRVETRAIVRFNLARALGAAGRDRARATRLARQARAEIQADPSVLSAGEFVRQIDAWLARHGR